MICPECGKEMEPGFVRADRAFLHWVERITWAGRGGELLGGSDPFQGAHLPAFRCQSCKLLMAHYESYDDEVKRFISGSSLTYSKQ